MIYSSDDHILIRDLREGDGELFAAEEQKQGWLDASPDKLETHRRDALAGKCTALVAEYGGQPAGYVQVYWQPDHGPFVGTNIPEISDFAVLDKFRRLGVGSRLMDVAEAVAAERCDTVSIGVGLHSGYGSAQRMYVKRGYIPDGSGVWFNGSVCPEYAPCENNDELVLYFSKPNPKKH